MDDQEKGEVHQSGEKVGDPTYFKAFHTQVLSGICGKIAMKINIVIPVYNEEAYLTKTLQSLVEQTHLPAKIIVVNDGSTDGTQKIIDSFSEKYGFIKAYSNTIIEAHAPGSKVINAFYKGYDQLDRDYDIICKFDGDLIFPKHYLASLIAIFEADSSCGMAGGFCYINENENWKLENLTSKEHIRGALKAYRKSCFEQIGGLKKSMGWDTVDELLAQYHGWKVKTDPNLKVKHLKPTGSTYSKSSKFKQGEAFYKLRYGFALTTIAAAKLAFKKGSLRHFTNTIRGYWKASNNQLNFLVSEKEGHFIRKLRWKGIKNKLF